MSAGEHPDASLPGVLLDAPLLDTARSLRGRLGDAAFFGLLGKSGDSGWGDLGTGWDAARFEAALAAPPGHTERDALVAALQERAVRVRRAGPQRGHWLRGHR